jgi:hypothetical protein
VNPETPAQMPGIAVLLCRKGRFEFDHLVPLSSQPTGVAITHDGRLLVVADDAYAAFLRTSDAVAGHASLAGAIKLSSGDIETMMPARRLQAFFRTINLRSSATSKRLPSR